MSSEEEGPVQIVSPVVNGGAALGHQSLVGGWVQPSSRSEPAGSIDLRAGRAGALTDDDRRARRLDSLGSWQPRSDAEARAADGHLVKGGCMAESTTENLFREFHGPSTFVEKRDIPKSFGFRSKRVGSADSGYPDFFKDMGGWLIVVEAKSGRPGPRSDHDAAISEVQDYMLYNAAHDVDIIGIAISGQTAESLRVSYFFRADGSDEVEEMQGLHALITIDDLARRYDAVAHGDPLSDTELRRFLTRLNSRLHKDARVRDTERSLFFSAVMIALGSDNFRTSYKGYQKPDDGERLIDAHELNEHIIRAVVRRLGTDANPHSKAIDWADRFAFIKTVDIPLDEYKSIISDIEQQIYQPSRAAVKKDVLGRAYRIFLSRAGGMDNKNIILTPDHVKTFMVELADLQQNDVVLDTCMGSGGFLMDAMETLVTLASGDTDRISDIHEKQLVGFELDPTLFALAKSNMFLHGNEKPILLYRDSLVTRSKTDVVAAGDAELRDYVKGLMPNKCIINPPYENDNPINFTLSALEYLADRGTLVVIMPNNTLSKTVNRKAALSILGKASLDFVIDMPQQLFFEQKRGVKTSVFGFTKTSHGHERDRLVTFVDMADDGHEVKLGHGRLDSGAWAEIARSVKGAIRDHEESSSARSWRTTIFADGELVARGTRANPWPQTQTHDLDAAIADWQEARTARESAQHAMSAVLAAAGIVGFDA
ncbi:class I SAM-dependent DNA methyltransferase [Curtobacterium luteum]|uniref:HsdM family class I SAM-dependent methyltransferase n=1 Tax=Curtobacterium luteum TaxID=33881 RepID=UPI00381E08D2